MKAASVIYPVEPWTVTESAFDSSTNARSETIFTVANGYIGIRGSFEEGYAGPAGTSLNGTFINGFYETGSIIYGEEFHGYAKNRQTMLNVTDGKIIELIVDGETFDLFSGRVLAFKRQLDMKRGRMIRSITWESPSGKRVDIRIERMASFVHEHLAAIKYEVTPLNFSGTIGMISALEGAVRNRTTEGDPRTGSAFGGQVLALKEKYASGTFGAVWQQTAGTRFSLVCAIEHRLNAEYAVIDKHPDQRVEKHFRIKAEQGQTIILEKYIAYCTSRHGDDSLLLSMAEAMLQTAVDCGFAAIAAEQEAYLEEFWQTANIEIDGDDALQQGLRFNAFHLLQSAGRDGYTNIAAKGLTGEGYEGHYFWDTETYMLPFFQFVRPEIAKRLLLYRHWTLPAAKRRAAEMAHVGALYPWRTIGGEECSAHYPSGTAQYHIDADIAYAVKQYAESSGDLEFLYGEGAEMLFEIAKFFEDAGCHIEGKGFCINAVTGPDEYTALINNNAYTNLMVKDLFEFAVKVARSLQAERPDRWRNLCDAVGIREVDIAKWERAAEAMYIHRARGLIGQDDSFLDKAVWDFAGTPKERYPLLLHYHPLVLYRHQVLKQADLVLAMYLQSKRFTIAEKLRNYDYYEPLTTHDSSLSTCIHAIVGAEIGYLDQAYDFFLQTVRTDLDDYHGNTKDGIHSASMAGSYLAVVSGFGGMRLTDGCLSFEPKLPRQWKGYTFRMAYLGSVLAVHVTESVTTYELLHGGPVKFRHLREELELEGRVTLPNRTLKAVLFDLDGVITDTAKYHYLAWKEIADELRIPFDLTVNERMKGVSRMESLEIMLEAGGAAELSTEKKAQLAERKNERYRKLIAGVTESDLLPGIAGLLDELKRRGVRIALGSASRNAPAILQALGIADKFDVIVDASAVGRGKPDPETFLTAADLLDVPPSCCLGVEDAAAGIASLRKAGIASIGIGDHGLLCDADAVIAHTAQLDWPTMLAIFNGHRA